MRRALLVAAIVVAHAVVQGLTVLGDPVPIASVGFVASAVLSLVAIAVAAWAVATLVQNARWRWTGLAWMLGAVILATALSILSPYLAPVAILVGLVLVPPVIAGTGPRGGLLAIRRHPVRRALALLGVLVLIVVGMVVALVLGLFVTGMVAAIATWIVFGALGAVVLWRWTRATPGAAPAAS